MTDPVLGDLDPASVRVRFSPVPTGNLDLGSVRTALVNWAFARHHGGTLVLRIEDAALGRATSGAYHAIIDSLHWLGIDWDEGPEVGGGNGPYRQSERFPIYAEAARALREEGAAYDCYCTPQELAERRTSAGSTPRGYDGFCRALGADRLAVWQAQGRTPVLRFRMPDEPVVVDDLVRGPLTFGSEDAWDFAILRANGDPLRALTDPLDDAMMGVTHVLRGSEHLASTTREVPLHRTLQQLGVGDGPPRFGHLPEMVGDDPQPEDGDSLPGLLDCVDQGFLPEGLLNYLALLGGGIADDHEIFTLRELARGFDLRRVGPDPVHFDTAKLEAVNSAHMRRISLPDLTERVIPFLAEAELVDEPIAHGQRQLLARAMSLVAGRMNTLAEVVPLLAFLFQDEGDFARVEEIDEAGRAVVRAAYDALSSVEDWSTASIEAALREALGDGEGLEAREAFAPVRVAVTGGPVSPPLFESMELLGRDRSLSRLGAALA